MRTMTGEFRGKHALLPQVYSWFSEVSLELDSQRDPFLTVCEGCPRSLATALPVMLGAARL